MESYFDSSEPAHGGQAEVSVERTGEGVTVTLGPAEELAAARRAWRAKHDAEDNLKRLRKYTRMNAGMKRDSRESAEALHEADKTLERILSVRA